MSQSVEPAFTLDFLSWSPWLERATETDLPSELREKVEAAVGPAPNSDYINVLANDYEAWRTRNTVHRHVYTSTEPEPTANRELGATTTSRINGCVFCASVHARIYAQASGRREVIERFLADGVDADLPPLERAIVDLGAKLTRDPESLTAADLGPLREQGLDDDGILDVINYTAFFANANRLMLSLGSPSFERAYQGGSR